MEYDDFQSHQKFLKKLRGKAECCRFSHSELKEKYSKLRSWKEFFVVLLSATLIALTGLYYRKIFADELILLLIFFLPIVITLVQTLDCTLFQLAHKVARHESAVAIWGDWIREADFLEKRIHHYPNDIADEKMQNIQEKYNSCMGNTEQIPNNKFLKYKKKFRTHVLKSKEIDEMSLAEIEKKSKK